MEKELQELIDKEKIRSVIYDNVRAMDRLDEELMLSTYHEDAWDYHGTTDAIAAEFVKKSMVSSGGDISASHQLGQIRVEVEGNKAFAETYFLNQMQRDENATLLPFDEPGVHLVLSSGRYIDHFEKRNDVWKISERKVLLDYIHADKLNNMGIDMNIFYRAKRSKEDESYNWKK